MSEFTKFKIGVALALLGVLFALQPLMQDAQSARVLLIGLSLKVIWFYYMFAALLGLSIYLYALASIREQPPRWIETAGNLVYAVALSVPTLFILLWLSSAVTSFAGMVLKKSWSRHLLSGLLGAVSSFIGAELSGRLIRVLARRDKSARVDQAQSAEVFHLDRAQTLLDGGHHDLAILESYRATESALTGALAVRDIRPRRPFAIFEAAVEANLLSPDHVRSYNELRDLRNHAVHKEAPMTKEQALSALAMARAVLGGLKREWPPATPEEGA